MEQDELETGEILQLIGVKVSPDTKRRYKQLTYKDRRRVLDAARNAIDREVLAVLFERDQSLINNNRSKLTLRLTGESS